MFSLKNPDHVGRGRSQKPGSGFRKNLTLEIFEKILFRLEGRLLRSTVFQAEGDTGRLNRWA